MLDDDGEVYEPAFDGPPGTVLAGLPLINLNLPTPYVSRGLPYQDACAKHVTDTFKASRVYIVASRSLSTSTDKVDKLVSAIGNHRVVGVGKEGISPHSPISEILEIAAECREKKADCVVTLGAGSITDGCKLVVYVSRELFPRKPLNRTEVLTCPSGPSKRHQDPGPTPPILLREHQCPLQHQRTHNTPHHDPHNPKRRRSQSSSPLSTNHPPN